MSPVSSAEGFYTQLNNGAYDGQINNINQLISQILSSKMIEGQFRGGCVTQHKVMRGGVNYSKSVIYKLLTFLPILLAVFAYEVKYTSSEVEGLVWIKDKVLLYDTIIPLFLKKISPVTLTKMATFMAASTANHYEGFKKKIARVFTGQDCFEDPHRLLVTYADVLLIMTYIKKSIFKPDTEARPMTALNRLVDSTSCTGSSTSDEYTTLQIPPGSTLSMPKNVSTSKFARTSPGKSASRTARTSPGKSASRTARTMLRSSN